MATGCRTLIGASLSSFQLTKPKFNPRLFSRSVLPRRGLEFNSVALSCSSLDLPPAQPEDTVEELLTRGDRIERLMKMERRPDPDSGGSNGGRWFPYLDAYKAESVELRSVEVIEALDPYIMEGRKERIRRAVENRSYSVCLVVEGLTDFGNVSAAFRSADALGIQSVHVISSDSKKRCC